MASGPPKEPDTAAPIPVRALDGALLSTYAEFCAEFSRSVLAGQHDWRGNLDAFNDILRGSFGTPAPPWLLRWTHAARSREALGWEATTRWLTAMLQTCHSTNVELVRERLARAERREGETLFDIIVSIVRDHGVGGPEAEDGILLDLED